MYAFFRLFVLYHRKALRELILQLCPYLCNVHVGGQLHRDAERPRAGMKPAVHVLTTEDDGVLRIRLYLLRVLIELKSKLIAVNHCGSRHAATIDNVLALFTFEDHFHVLKSFFLHNVLSPVIVLILMMTVSPEKIYVPSPYTTLRPFLSGKDT